MGENTEDDFEAQLSAQEGRLGIGGGVAVLDEPPAAAVEAPKVSMVETTPVEVPELHVPTNTEGLEVPAGAVAQSRQEANAAAYGKDSASTIDHLGKGRADSRAQEDIKESDAELAAIQRQFAAATTQQQRQDLLNEEMLVRTAKLARLESLRNSGALINRRGPGFADSYKYDAQVERTAIDQAAEKLKSLSSAGRPENSAIAAAARVEPRPVSMKVERPAAAKKTGPGFFSKIGSGIGNAFRGIKSLYHRRKAEAHSATAPAESAPAKPAAQEVSRGKVFARGPITAEAAPAAPTSKVESKLSPNEIAAIDFSESLQDVLTNKFDISWSYDEFQVHLDELLAVKKFGDRTDEAEIAKVMNRIMYQAAQDTTIAPEARDFLARLLDDRKYSKIENVGSELKLTKLEKPSADLSEAISGLRKSREADDLVKRLKVEEGAK